MTNSVPEAKKKTPSLMSKLLTLLLVSVSMFLVAEVVVRTLYKDTTHLFPRYHTKTQYGDYTLRRIRPNMEFTHTSIDGEWLFTTNAQGFRNLEDFEYDKPQGFMRVVSIGDSHTQGYEVAQDYTYSSVLERHLNSNGLKAQVLNTGVSGFGNAEQLLLLENELVKYEPDYVVLGFSFNDFEDNVKVGFFEINESGELVRTEKREHAPGVGVQDLIYSIPGIQFLSENSYFYSLLFNTVWEFAKNQLIQQGVEATTDFAVALDTDYSTYEIRLAELLVQRIHQVANENGARLILMDIASMTPEGEPIPTIFGEFREAVVESSDFYLGSEILDDYKFAARVHAPNGLRHISEFAHTMYGVELGRIIMQAEGLRPADISSAH